MSVETKDVLPEDRCNPCRKASEAVKKESEELEHLETRPDHELAKSGKGGKAIGTCPPAKKNLKRTYYLDS